MNAYQLNPLDDSRWARFVEKHPRASVFHTVEWLNALHQTYGYKPVAFTTSSSDSELANGLAFCRISTWLTGKRLVSLPFSDHCEILVDATEELNCILASLQSAAERDGFRYVEMRPRSNAAIEGTRFHQAAACHFHTLDLQPSADELFRSFHKNCVQRKIQRAERERLTHEEGRSELLLKKFYGMYVAMRRRHGVPPQPILWFRNLIANLGERLKIHIVSKDGRPAAGILTLCHKQTLVYKYGCSDPALNRTGSMHFVIWKAIQEAKSCGLHELDMGRTGLEDSGLSTFKDRWNCTRSTLTYWKYPARAVESARPSWPARASKQIISCLPDGVVATAGSLLYKHIG